MLFALPMQTSSSVHLYMLYYITKNAPLGLVTDGSSERDSSKSHSKWYNYLLHPVLELAICNTRISVAPAAVKSSITVAIVRFSTIELTATQSGSSSAVTVGALMPGVIPSAVFKRVRWTLYWHKMYFCAARLSQCHDSVEGGRIRILTDNTFNSRCNKIY